MSNHSATGRVAGLVLAAGGSRRLGVAKQLVVGNDGRTLVERSARQLIEAGCDPVLVVVGAAFAQVTAALHGVPVEICVNRQWEEGMGSSIRLVMSALLAQESVTEIDAVLITTCDMPTVTGAHLRELIATGTPMHSRSRANADRGWRRVASAYNGGVERDASSTRMRGVPALFPKSDWPALAELSGDRGAKTLVELPDTVLVMLGTDHFDIDTPEDLAQWQNRPTSP